MLVAVDTREPEPHPWERYLPERWRFERGTLETGDIALAALSAGAVVERKTSSDMVSCIGGGRERFERELKRGRYCGRMVVLVEGSLADVVVAGGYTTKRLALPNGNSTLCLTRRAALLAGESFFVAVAFRSSDPKSIIYSELLVAEPSME